MSTSDDTSPFAHLFYEFPGGDERPATKALGYILNRSGPALAALRDMLKVDGADVGPLVRVETEVKGEGEDKNRPDLVAYDEADKKRVIVEVKFDADLADNQPVDYLRQLPGDDHLSVLLFIAPEYRLERLWPEILVMARRGRFTLNGMIETGRLRVAAVAEGNRRLMLTSWRLLLEKMRSRASVDGESSAEQAIRQLNEWCEREDFPPFRPLLETEIGPESPGRMLNFQRLVDDATAHLVREKRANIDGLRVAPQATGYGRYLRIGSKEAWLGVNCKLWAQEGKEQTPIWIQFDDDARPLPLRPGVEYEEVLKDLVNQLCELADRLAPASEAS